jgi:nucleotide-binding universal stress UspA family protein
VQAREAPGVVLVAWDGSEAGAMAIPVAMTLASQMGAGIEILHVQPQEAVDMALLNELRAAAARPEDVSLRVRQGDPAKEIVKATREEDVILVVMTTHGRTIEARRGMGHVAEEVVRLAERPVLLVKPEGVLARAPCPVRSLLLPLDGTPRTAVALRPATELACRLGARVDLLYVASEAEGQVVERGSMSAPRYVDQPQHEWPCWTSEAIRRLAKSCAGAAPTVPTHMYLAQGDVGEQIVNFAAQHGSDIIVLVRRSRLEPGRARALKTVLRDASCPVLVLGGPAK